MSLFGGIFENKSVQNALLGKVKTLLKDNGVKTVVIKLDENGEMVTETYKEDMKILTPSEYAKFINIINSQL